MHRPRRQAIYKIKRWERPLLDKGGCHDEIMTGGLKISTNSTLFFLIILLSKAPLVRGCECPVDTFAQQKHRPRRQATLINRNFKQGSPCEGSWHRRWMRGSFWLQNIIDYCIPFSLSVTAYRRATSLVRERLTCSFVKIRNHRPRREMSLFDKKFKKGPLV